MKHTAALLALNVLVFAAYVVSAVDEPAAVIGLVTGGYPAGVPVGLDSLWPGISTYMFGHAGVTHLVMNMMMLVVIGRGLEERAGVRVIPIYLAGGTIGAVAHLTYYGMAGIDAPLIGASAAVSGVFGAAVIYRTITVGGVFYYLLVLNVLPLAGVAAGILADDGISYVSHIGGAVAGLAAAACFAAAGAVGRRNGRRHAVDPDWEADITNAPRAS